MIYLDNSATTKQLPEVTERMLEYMNECFGNPSSLHRMGLAAEKGVKTARRQTGAAFPQGGKIVFTSGGTEADNMALFGGAKAGRRRGRRIVTTKVEHPAVLECCAQLEQEGFEVIRIGVDRCCRPDLDALKEAVNEDTILVSVMQVNNEAGTVLPLDEIAGICRSRSKALLHCDAVQSFGKVPLPQGADLISVSGHKIHGPKGIGALWIRDGVRLPALIHGGGQEKDMRSGTENVPAIAGFGTAVEIADRDREKNMEHLADLRADLLEGLTSEISDTVVNSPRESGAEPGQCCPSILNVSFPGTRGEVILHTLEQSGICVSTGSACSSNKKGRSHVLQAMGCSDKEIEGAIRFSLSAMNTKEEIAEAVEKTAEAVKRFRRLGSFR